MELREAGVHKKRGRAQDNYEGLTELYIDDKLYRWLVNHKGSVETERVGTGF